MVLGRDAEVLSGLPPAVVNTITSARALSTRQAYRLKWNLFVDWCSPRREDPRRCTVGSPKGNHYTWAPSPAQGLTLGNVRVLDLASGAPPHLTAEGAGGTSTGFAVGN